MVVLVLIPAAVAHYDFGMERETVFLFADGFAFFAFVIALADYKFGCSGFLSVFPVVFVSSIVVLTLTVVVLTSVSIALITIAVFVSIASIAIIIHTYKMVFLRAFGFFLGEAGAIWFGLYYLPDPVAVAGAGIAGIALMYAALYAPWLRG
ncbi:MAG: hypothetical protein HYW81_01340 [Parcubacteria group bacterium]|nr:hypothetical protein [Parcubacteria group bacterium]